MQLSEMLATEKEGEKKNQTDVEPRPNLVITQMELQCVSLNHVF